MAQLFSDADYRLVEAISMEAFRLLDDKRDVEKICNSSAYWMSMSRHYVLLVEQNMLEPIGTLSGEKKRRYWNEVNQYAGDRERWVKVSICQALYLFDKVQEHESAKS